MATNDGGPAFPCPDSPTWAVCPRCNAQVQRAGMSLRDYFAGQSLVGVVGGDFGSFRELAEECYGIADAMLAERNRVTTPAGAAGQDDER